MAEFCLDCWNKLNERNDNEKKYILSDDLDLCEGCGGWKPVIIMTRKRYYMYKFRYIIFPFKVIFIIIYFLLRLIILPYLIYMYKNAKNKRPKA